MSKYPDMAEIFERLNARSERLRALPAEEQEHSRIVFFGTEYEVFKLPRLLRTTLTVHCEKCGAEMDPALAAPGIVLCQKCCVEHDYQFDDISRERRCKRCDVQVWPEPD